MEATVAIFSERNDVHAAAVQWALARNHTQSFIAPDVSAIASRISIHASDQGLSWSTPKPGNFQRIRSVWFRRPQKPGSMSCLEEDKEFVTQQWTLLQKNVFDLGSELIDALWVNRPHAALAAESKILQLKEAQAVDLSFPEMVVTNHAEDVTKLINRWGRVVYKSFYPHTWHSVSQHRYHSVGVALLDGASEIPEASVALCPGIFQRYIDKKLDIRVTVIGDRMYAMEILRKNGGALLDWRDSIMEEQSVMRPCRLGQPVEKKITSLMRRLGIVFGCIDLVVDHDDNVFFLEVNQAGQFLFVEDKVSSTPLLRAITAMLIEGRCDYSIDTCKEVSLSDYFSSEEYQEITREITKSIARPRASLAMEK